MNEPLFNRTKIIATIGPACSALSNLEKMMRAGMDVARLNFSHGNRKFHKEVIDRIRALNKKCKVHIGIMADLQGPKLRVGEMAGGKIFLKKGADILITSRVCEGTEKKIFVNYAPLAIDLKTGERILLDDGKIELLVTEIVNDHSVRAKIIFGGELSSHKGFNLPDSILSITAFTKKDLDDLDFIIKEKVEWIALSFVRKPEDVFLIRNILKKKKSDAKLIAKIEKPEAVKNIDGIIAASDAVMVARGDLGVEIALEEVPIIQKQIVRKCLDETKPVIIATQMMESMINNSTPTRAEANDVSNAVMDGADAVMLSGETSIGKHPVRVVETMQRIIAAAENQSSIFNREREPGLTSETYLSDEVCFTACRLAENLGAKGITGMTVSGYTAFKLASFRPRAGIFIFTGKTFFLNTLSLLWGVRGFFYNKYETTDHTIEDVNNILLEAGFVQKGDIVVNTASMPIREKQRTNTIKISRLK